MLHIGLAIIVEGKYDKMRVERVCDAPVFTTEGFRIFKDCEKRRFLCRLASSCGILVLTDSDRAGFLIRNHIKGIVGEGKVYHAYIPEMDGKERRKRRPSKEGHLGVEGMEDKLLEDILKKYTADCEIREKITKTDFFEAGLYGGANSAAARIALCKRLSVPAGISADAMIDAVNALITKEEFFEMVTNEYS